MDEHIEKIVAQMVKYPVNFGHHCELPLYKHEGYGNTGISINRDSDALERSNKPRRSNEEGWDEFWYWAIVCACWGFIAAVFLVGD